MGGPRLGSPFPTPTPPRDDRETAAIEFVQEQVPGEVELDALVRAQASAPQIVARMIALENCIWSLASLLLSLPAETREKIRAQGPLETAKALLLKSVVLDHNLELPDRSTDEPERTRSSTNTLFPYPANAQDDDPPQTPR